jgi:hypothetical protein
MDKINEYTLYEGQMITYINDVEFKTIENVRNDFEAEILIQVLNKEIDIAFCTKNNIK